MSRKIQVLKSETEANSSVLSDATDATAANKQSPAGGRVKGAVVQSELGFIGLGRMGKAMAANLAAAGKKVIAYVRRAEQLGELVALGLHPTTDIADVFDCEFVITMLPDDDAAREIVFGRGHLDGDGLAVGMIPGAIHLSMS